MYHIFKKLDYRCQYLITALDSSLITTINQIQRLLLTVVNSLVVCQFFQLSNHKIIIFPVNWDISHNQHIKPNIKEKMKSTYIPAK
jgi:hypothetical protein